MSERQTIFLLADSAALLCNGNDALLSALQRSLRVSERTITRAAYIGASNGDAREFFELFVAAMDGIDLHETRMIRSDFGDEDRAFLESADLVLLAGGDVDDGWRRMRRTGMDAVITSAYDAGAVLVGISAGAMQLGMGWLGGQGTCVSTGMHLVPYFVDVHGEREDWPRLRTLVAAREDCAKGFGISSGGAMIFNADMSTEALRYPATEFTKSARGPGRVTANLLLPTVPATPVRVSTIAYRNRG